MRILAIIFFSLVLISCIDTQGSYFVEKKLEYINIYNTKNLSRGFKKVEVSKNKLMVNDEFIDGEFSGILYNDYPIKINNCVDLYKYDLREITNILHTDLSILRERKRACKILSKIDKLTAINPNYITFMDSPSESDLLSTDTIHKILKAVNLNTDEFQCSIDYLNMYSIDCQNEYTYIGIMPIIEYTNSVIYFVNVESGRLQDYYTVEASNESVKAHLQL